MAKHIGIVEAAQRVLPCVIGPSVWKQLLSARIGNFEVSRDDIVFADDDGCIFTSRTGVAELLSTANAVWTTERRQAQAIVSGECVRLQLDFREYPAKRAADPAYTFRQHLRNTKAAIEE